MLKTIDEPVESEEKAIEEAPARARSRVSG
jgi:hypothetical protein